MSLFDFPICQCKGTVFIKIWYQVLMVTLYSVAAVLIQKHTTWRITIPMTLVPILGVATGMLLVFRTNTAYDRYWDARRQWSMMTTCIRNLTRNIWVGVKEPVDGDASKILVEKISALNILAAFGYATRNYLRGEYSYEDADLKQLLRHVPKFYNIDCKCKKTKTAKDILSEDMEGVGISMWCSSCYSTKKYRFTAYDEETPTHIPLELSYLLAAYIKNANAMNLIDPSLLAVLNNALNSLVDCVTGFERILRTPIPLAYSVHLHHATWIYILTLPCQLVEPLGWWTAFATSLTAFCLLGVLEIGWEIENPFGRDFNDLPLDDFCRVTHREIQRIMGRRIPSTDVWLMSPQNRPLAPTCSLNAQELVRIPPDDLRLLTKRDPVQMRAYFKNHAFTLDETPVDVEKDVEACEDETLDVENVTVKSDKKEQESSKSSKDSNKEESEEEEEEEEEEPVDMDMSAKRVSFALPAEEEIEMDEYEEEEEEEEEDEAEEEEEQDDKEKKKELNTTAETKKVNEDDDHGKKD